MAAPVTTALFAGIALGAIRDRSNMERVIGSSLPLPVCAAVLFTKYSAGDWDLSYQWTRSDALYWPTTALVALVGVGIGRAWRSSQPWIKKTPADR